MTTPAGDGKTPHRARNLFDGIDLASNTMKVCMGSKAEVQRGPRNVRFWGYSGLRFWATGCLLIATNGLSEHRRTQTLAPVPQVCAARAGGTLSQRKKTTGRAFDRQIG